MLRHPVTGRRFRVSARTRGELAMLVGEVERLRTELRIGMTSEEEIARRLARLSHGRVTLEHAATVYASSGEPSANSARRIRSFLRAAGKSLASLELDALDAPALTRWEASLRTLGYAASTIAGAWRTLRQVARYATARGWIVRSPWGDVYRPAVRASGAGRLEREAARTPDELRRLLAAARWFDLQRSRRGELGDLEAKIAAASLLGLRQGEIAGLRWPDVDRATLTVAVVRQWDGAPLKTRRPAVLAAVPELFAALADLEVQQRRLGLFDPRGPVFLRPVSGRPAPFAPGTEPLSRRQLRHAVSVAGLPSPARWSAHSLRDTFATLEATARGGDLRAVADRTRHASIASLVRYLRSLSRDPPAPGFVLGSPADSPPALPEHAPPTSGGRDEPAPPALPSARRQRRR